MNKKSSLFAILLLACLLAFAACAAPLDIDEANTNPDITAASLQITETVNSFCEALYDDYAFYFTPDQYRIMRDDYEGVFGGIGVKMTDADGEIKIHSVIDDTPASRAGLQSGEVILAADGESLVGQDSSLAAVKIRGEIGSAVELTLRRNDGTTYDISLVREEIISESITGEILPDLANTAYIILYSFSEHTASEFVDLFNKLNQETPIHRIILDLRSNGGGSFPAAISMANFFTPVGDVIVSEKKATEEKVYTSTSGQLQSIELLVLQNGWTASASEVLAGALRDNAGAVLIGSTSFGKGITQTISGLPSGAGYRQTASRYYTPSGYDLHGIGLLPDIEVADPPGITSADYFSTDPARNPHLAAALDFVKSAE